MTPVRVLACMQNHENLRVWRLAHGLVCEVYRATVLLPRDERYELRRQVRRAAVSIPANIAEGCARGTDRDFAHFLRMALGSANEVDYYLLLARDLELLADSTCAPLRESVQHVRALLLRFIDRLTPHD